MPPNNPRRAKAGYRDTAVSVQLPVRYLEAGRPDAPAMVLVHDGGNGSDAELCWSRLITRISPSYHVVAPDLTGYGGSAKVAWFDADPIIQRTRFLQRFCESLGIGQAAFVGSSFGGAVVLAGAAYGLLPMTAGISICGTGGPHMIGERFERLRNYTPDPANARYLWDQMVLRPNDAQVRARHRRSLVPGHWEVLAAARLRNPAAPAPPGSARERYVRALGQIRIPFLFIAGQQDELLEPGWERQMAMLVPGAKSVVIPNTKHQPHIDQPARVSTIIDDFVASTREAS